MNVSLEAKVRYPEKKSTSTAHLKVRQLMRKIKTKNSPSVWLFFIFTFIWSWSFWIPIIFLRLGIGFWVVQLGIALGALGPLVFGFLFKSIENEGRDFSEYFERIFDFKRIEPLWWVAVLFVVPLFAFIAGEIDWLLGGEGLSIRLNPLVFLFVIKTPVVFSALEIIAFFMLLGPVLEEPGWRGYALDHLQEQNGPWKGSLIMGGVWWLWHLPLFFIGLSYAKEMSVQLFRYLSFFLPILLISFLMTWIYNHTKKSTLACIFFHFVCNVCFLNSIFTVRAMCVWLFLIMGWVCFIAVWKKDKLLGYSEH